MTARPPLSPPGTLFLSRGRPNPQGMGEAELILLAGDATAAPVRELAPTAELPPPHYTAERAESPFHLKIVHFNDLHGHIARLTADSSYPIFSRIAWHLYELRRRYRNDPHTAVLALSAGDDLVGTVFDELLGRKSAPYLAHAPYRLYSAAGIDAATLGNHDLDWGSERLAQAIESDAAFPVLSANLVGGRWLAGRYYPAALFLVKGIRIGLIGLTTPAQIQGWENAGFHVVHPIQAIQNLLPAMRPWCDVLIVLSHLGYRLDADSALVLEAGDVELAENLPAGSIHLIVGGHTHHALNPHGLSLEHIVNGVPIVQAGAMGEFVGQVDISLRSNGVVEVTDARLIPTAELAVAETFEHDQVRPLVTQAHSYLAQRLGRVADHADLSAEAVRNRFAAGESALANFITDALVEQCRAAGHWVDFAMIDASSVLDGLPVSGDLTFGDWFNLMPFADTIRLYRMRGDQLERLLADNARRVDYPDEPHAERGFLHFSREVRYVISLGSDRQAAQALYASVNGRPIFEQLQHTFTVAATNFVRVRALAWEREASRQLGLPLLNLQELPYTDTDLFVRDELLAYLRRHGGVSEVGGVRRDGRLQLVYPCERFREAAETPPAAAVRAERQKPS